MPQCQRTEVESHWPDPKGGGWELKSGRIRARGAYAEGCVRRGGSIVASRGLGWPRVTGRGGEQEKRNTRAERDGTGTCVFREDLRELDFRNA